MSSMSFQSALAFEPPPLLLRRFCAENDVCETEALSRFHETKKFLILCANDRRASYSPSKAVDVMWHQFMLHSHDYFKFCDLVGGYIHHQPSETHQPECYAKTLEDMPKLFGSINTSYWSEKAADCSDCSSTCDCCP
jgi:hypothetical protein